MASNVEPHNFYGASGGYSGTGKYVDIVITCASCLSVKLAITSI